MNDEDSFVHVDRERMDELLLALERMAGGDTRVQAPLSPARDELDAIAHAVNVLAGELVFRLRELQAAQSQLVQSGKLIALGEVSAGLAHELNNPLAILRGFGEMTRDLVREARHGRPFDAELAEQYLERMDGHIVRISTIITHVKEFSRQAHHERRRVAINDVVGRSFVLLHEQLRLQRIQVDLRLAPDGPIVHGDPLRLEQVFINLLTNARDAIADAPAQAGTITVATQVLSDGMIEATVSDDGVGMDAAVLQEIFTPFYTTKAAGKGTGLGLSISHGIIAEHGGRIHCASEPGRGTRMRIVLPPAPAVDR
jgi:C4-dicarboxylate-specific signal transduction histidine kinase